MQNIPKNKAIPAARISSFLADGDRKVAMAKAIAKRSAIRSSVAKSSRNSESRASKDDNVEEGERVVKEVEEEIVNNPEEVEVEVEVDLEQPEIEKEEERKEESVVVVPKVVPKKPSGPYIWFCMEKIALYKEIPQKERIRKIGTEWKLLDPAQRIKYTELQQADIARYQNETQELETKGFFTNKEGVKSTEVKPELKDFPKGTVLPKKAIQAHMMFMKHNDAKMRLEYKDLNFFEWAKKRFEKWHTLPADEK